MQSVDEEILKESSMVLTHGSVAEEVDTDTVGLFGFILKDCMDNVSHNSLEQL